MEGCDSNFSIVLLCYLCFPLSGLIHLCIVRDSFTIIVMLTLPVLILVSSL